MNNNIGRLHVITDNANQERFSHVDLARLMVAGGADAIQYRDKLADTRTLIETASEMNDLCMAAGVPLIVNDRIDVALAVGAAGVHLGQDDVPVEEARRLLGPERIIGATATNALEARAAERIGADYIGFGHIYDTRSKAKTTTPKGPRLITDIANTLSIPLIAIGGINADNISAVLEAGAAGAAVIGAVCLVTKPEQATRALRKIIDSHFEQKKRREH